MQVGDYVVVRTASAGVHAGYLVSRDGDEVVLKESRRLWRWVPAKLSNGLASLSEVAVHGINGADSRSQTGVRVPEHLVLGVIEVLPCSGASRASIEAAP